jgi:hypothetical protein
LFYSAVHYVHSYLSAKNVPLPLKMDHAKRLTMVERFADLKPLYDDYRELYDQSRYARYDPAVPFSQNDVARLQKNLEVIKNRIEPLIQ